MALEVTFVKGVPAMADYTPSSACVSGQVVVVNDAVRVVHSDIAANTLGAAAVGGGIYLCTGDAAISDGKKVYWNNTDNKVTETATGNKVFGHTVSACSGDGGTCYVYHNGAY